jgi:hypothetical protein
LAVEPNDLFKDLCRDAAMPNRHVGSMQMLCHGSPMQAPSPGNLLHAVASLIFGNEALDFVRQEPALYLPLPYGLRSHSSAEQRGQYLG